MPKREAKDMDVAGGFQELETIAEWFEKGETDIDRGLEKFERAMAVAQALKKKLTAAENRIKEIKKDFNLD